jgi:excisionase family DNA binding protein
VPADAATLHLLRWCIGLAEGVLGRDCPDHPMRPALPDARDWIDAEISLARNQSDDVLPESEPTEWITTAETAKILGLTQRRVQQKIKAGELKAERFGRTYRLNRRDIA